MKSFIVTKIQWASYSDMALPFFTQWNKQNKLPKGFWQRIWEYPFAMLHIPYNDFNLDVGGTYPFVLFKHFPNTVSLDIRDLNALDHPLHKGKWASRKLIIGDAQHMPFRDNQFRYSFSISAIEEMPDPVSVLREMIRTTRERIVITMDISNELGIDDVKLKDILSLLGVSLPPIPDDAMRSDDTRQKQYHQPLLHQYNHIRVLGIVIDRDDQIKECGILIPHSESLPFLKLCIQSIQGYAHPNVKQHIYVIDDNSQDGSYGQAQKLWGSDSDISLIQIKRDNFAVPDIGQLLDRSLEHVQEQFVAMIDADVFAMNNDWLRYPIWLLEKNGCSSVGCDTGLSLSYMDKVPGVWKNATGYQQGFSLFSNDFFTCTNNFYRVCRTADAKVVSSLAGYHRIKTAANRILDKIVNGAPRAKSVVPTLSPFGRHPETPFIHRHSPRSSGVMDKVSARVNALFKKRLIPYMYIDFPNADNGVRANYFIDANKLGPKFSLPIVNWLGKTPADGVFGQNICSLIFHFALSSRALQTSHKEISDVGKEYMAYAKNIESGNVSMDTIREWFSHVSMDGGNGKNRDVWFHDQYRKFEASYNEYKRNQVV